MVSVLATAEDAPTKPPTESLVVLTAAVRLGVAPSVTTRSTPCIYRALRDAEFRIVPG
jgi:hypothetical protein